MIPGSTYRPATFHLPWSRAKARVATAENEGRESHFMLLGVYEGVRE